MGIRERFGWGKTQVQEPHEAFKKRAQERAEERARRRKRFLVPVGSVVTTAGLVALFLYSPITAVAKINVLGPVNDAQRAATQTHLNGLIGRQMIDLNMREVDTLVTQQHWVESSNATKSWPQSITVHVTVREPAIVVQSPSGEWAMDKAGFFIGPADQSLAHLVRVQTTKPISEADAVGSPGLVAAAKAVSVFPPSITDYVTQWSVDEAKGLMIDMKLQGVGSLQSVQVIIGDAEEIPYKTSVIEAIIQDLSRTDNTSGTIDVRVPSRPVVIG